MAPNGSSSRKTPVSSKSSKDDSLALENLFDDLEEFASATVKSKIKSELPQLEKPGNWDSKVNGGNDNKKASKDRSTSPPVNHIPPTLAKAFPNGKLMGDKPEVLKCSHCKRPALRHAMPAHIERCLNKKQEKQRKKKEAKDARDAAARREKGLASDDDDPEPSITNPDSAKKTATKSSNQSLTASKKRKAPDNDNESEAPPTKKKKSKKEEAKNKLPKPKAPVDVEKQCGVELPQGGQCARSLTCKSHSMGAKRAVPGRSAPYDKLLMEYQRKNQAKLQKAAFDANAPKEDEVEDGNGPVDEEEERDAVLGAIARNWGGRPLIEARFGGAVKVPLGKKYAVNRIKGMLGGALSGRGGSGLFGTGGGAAGAGKGVFGGGGGGGGAGGKENGPAMDADGVIHARRGSAVPGARSMMAPSRKPSVASALGT